MTPEKHVPYEAGFEPSEEEVRKSHEEILRFLFTIFVVQILMVLSGFLWVWYVHAHRNIQ